MKSILQSIALLSAAVLIASCDSSSGGSDVVVTPPAPQVSTSGSAVKGIIDGATVIASDTAGTRQIGSRIVTAGTYDIAYDT